MQGKTTTPGKRVHPPAANVRVPLTLRKILRIYAAKQDISWKEALARAILLLNADGAMDELLGKEKDKLT